MFEWPSFGLHFDIAESTETAISNRTESACSISPSIFKAHKVSNFLTIERIVSLSAPVSEALGVTYVAGYQADLMPFPDLKTTNASPL